MDQPPGKKQNRNPHVVKQSAPLCARDSEEEVERLLPSRDFSIQGSSVPCECLFSSAGLTDVNRRNALSSQSFENIQLLKFFCKDDRCKRELKNVGEALSLKRAWEESVDAVLNEAKRRRAV